MRTAYVYILGSQGGTLYIGVTNNLERRIWEHRNHVHQGFTTKYKVTKLLHMEEYERMDDAIAREATEGLVARKEAGLDSGAQFALERSGLELVL